MYLLPNIDIHNTPFPLSLVIGTHAAWFMPDSSCHMLWLSSTFDPCYWCLTPVLQVLRMVEVKSCHRLSPLLPKFDPYWPTLFMCDPRRAYFAKGSACVVAILVVRLALYELILQVGKQVGKSGYLAILFQPNTWYWFCRVISNCALLTLLIHIHFTISYITALVITNNQCCCYLLQSL